MSLAIAGAAAAGATVTTASGAVTRRPPANTAPPEITGEPGVGMKLTTSVGSWTGRPYAFRYRWRSCDLDGEYCTNIDNATASTYTVSAVDAGHTIRVVVTAVSGAGRASATSAATSVVASSTPPSTPLANTALPVVSGNPERGQALSASAGSWAGGPTSFAYGWEDCDAGGGACTSISEATSSSYTVGAGDIGHTIRVAVTASNAAGSASASSGPTGEVSAASGYPPPPSCTVVDTSLASVVSDAASQPAGSTICLSDGSYGALQLAAARSAYVTVKAENVGKVTLSGLRVASSASYLHIDGFVVTSNSQFGLPANDGSAPHDIEVTNTDSEGFQVEAGAHDYLFDHDSSHDGPYGFLLNGSRYPVAGGCCRTANYPVIENVTIENSKVFRPQADAFQIKGFVNVTVQDDDIADVVQNGNHNDGVQTVHGGANLTISHNYFHDGNAELFMIKDGVINGLTVTDNLSVRQSPSLNGPCGGCSAAVEGQIYAPTNAVIENNTFLQPALALRSQVGLVGNGNPEYPSPSNVVVSHNVMGMFRVQDDDENSTIGVFARAMTETDNVLGTWSRMYLTSPFPGPGTTFDNAPAFVCGSSCGDGTPVGDDYRLLLSNPDGAGVDWAPVQEDYGPAG